MKSQKKRWLATARKARYVRVEMLPTPGGAPVILQPGNWTTTTGDLLLRLIPISEAEARRLYIADSKVRLSNGAHSSVFQYADGVKAIMYSYTSGCKCRRCTPKVWRWRTYADGSKQLQAFDARDE